MVVLKPEKFNKLWVGLLSGLILPMIAFYFGWKIKYPETGFVEYLEILKILGIFLKVSSLCVAINLILFYPFLNSNRFLATRGVLMATLIYALVIMLVEMT